MTGYNLPPGVSVNMIPGNRPEDIAEEEFWTTFGDKLEAENIYILRSNTGSTDEVEIDVNSLWEDENFRKLVEIAAGMGYAKGYNEGSAEAEMAQALKEEQQ